MSFNLKGSYLKLDDFSQREMHCLLDLSRDLKAILVATLAG